MDAPRLSPGRAGAFEQPVELTPIQEQAATTVTVVDQHTVPIVGMHFSVALRANQAHGILPEQSSVDRRRVSGDMAEGTCGVQSSLVVTMGTGPRSITHVG